MFTLFHTGLEDIYMGTVSDHRKLLETSLFGWELAEAARPVPPEFERWFVPSPGPGWVNLKFQNCVMFWITDDYNIFQKYNIR